MTNSLHASKKLGVIPRVGRIRAQKKKTKKKQTDRQRKNRKKTDLFTCFSSKLLGVEY